MADGAIRHLPAGGQIPVGRDFADFNQDSDGFVEPTAASRRAQYRQGTH